MKPNIDLTEGRDFRRRETTYASLPWVKKEYQNLRLNRSKFPWVKDEPSPYTEKEIVFTGDKNIIKKKEMYALREQGEVCERCGIVLTNMPWNMVGMLCRKCDELLTYEINTSQDPLLDDLLNI